MDSVTRFCLALREIGLAAGEPPATRGYPPSVFAELPRLLERAGPGPEETGGHITAIFTVLVEGDDHNEPVADAVRGILDGHVILDRRIGESGRYPAVDVLRSLSRTVPGCLTDAERQSVRRAREALALQAELSDLVRLGAYQPGSDPAADRALRIAPLIERLISQPKGEHSTLDEAVCPPRPRLWRPIMARDPLCDVDQSPPTRVRRGAASPRELPSPRRAQDEQTAQMIERTIAEETQAASDPAGSDAVVEAFGAWLPGARRQAGGGATAARIQAGRDRPRARRADRVPDRARKRGNAATGTERGPAPQAGARGATRAGRSATPAGHGPAMIASERAPAGPFSYDVLDCAGR